jgi:hypothetical protein
MLLAMKLLRAILSVFLSVSLALPPAFSWDQLAPSSLSSLGDFAIALKLDDHYRYGKNILNLEKIIKESDIVSHQVLPIDGESNLVLLFGKTGEQYTLSIAQVDSSKKVSMLFERESVENFQPGTVLDLEDLKILDPKILEILGIWKDIQAILSDNGNKEMGGLSLGDQCLQLAAELEREGKKALAKTLREYSTKLKELEAARSNLQKEKAELEALLSQPATSGTVPAGTMTPPAGTDTAIPVTDQSSLKQGVTGAPVAAGEAVVASNSEAASVPHVPIEQVSDAELAKHWFTREVDEDGTKFLVATRPGATMPPHWATAAPWVGPSSSGAAQIFDTPAAPTGHKALTTQIVTSVMEGMDQSIKEQLSKAGEGEEKTRTIRFLLRQLQMLLGIGMQGEPNALLKPTIELLDSPWGGQVIVVSHSFSGSVISTFPNKGPALTYENLELIRAALHTAISARLEALKKEEDSNAIAERQAILQLVAKEGDDVAGGSGGVTSQTTASHAALQVHAVPAVPEAPPEGVTVDEVAVDVGTAATSGGERTEIQQFTIPAVTQAIQRGHQRLLKVGIANIPPFGFRMVAHEFYKKDLQNPFGANPDFPGKLFMIGIDGPHFLFMKSFDRENRFEKPTNREIEKFSQEFIETLSRTFFSNGSGSPIGIMGPADFEKSPVAIVFHGIELPNRNQDDYGGSGSMVDFSSVENALKEGENQTSGRRWYSQLAADGTKVSLDSEAFSVQFTQAEFEEALAAVDAYLDTDVKSYVEGKGLPWGLDIKENYRKIVVMPYINYCLYAKFLDRLANLSEAKAATESQPTEVSEAAPEGLTGKAGALEGPPQSRALDIPIPVPVSVSRLNDERARKWIEASEGKPKMQEVKRKIITSVRRITFSEFETELRKTVAKLDSELGGDEPYAVLWDHRPHGSKRWVYSLAQKWFSKKPAVTSYFRIGRTGSLKSIVDKGIQTFVIMDDAVYSGKQVARAIQQVKDLYKEWGRGEPRFIVVAPFVAKEAIEERLQGVKVLYSQIMPYLDNVLSLDEKEVLKENFGGRLNPGTGGKTILKTTLTYFDHTIADQHSFTEEVESLFHTDHVRRPYTVEGTPYYELEEMEFAEYLSSTSVQGSFADDPSGLAANAGEAVVVGVVPGAGDIRGPHVTDEQYERWTVKIEAESEAVQQANSDVVEWVSDRAATLIQDKSWEARATVIADTLTQQGLPREHLEWVLKALRSPPTAFLWFHTIVEGPETYLLGHDRALAVDLIRFLQAEEARTGIHDLLDEYILHEALERTNLTHPQIIALTRDLFQRGEQNPLRDALRSWIDQVLETEFAQQTGRLLVAHRKGYDLRKRSQNEYANFDVEKKIKDTLIFLFGVVILGLPVVLGLRFILGLPFFPINHALLFLAIWIAYPFLVLISIGSGLIGEFLRVSSAIYMSFKISRDLSKRRVLLTMVSFQSFQPEPHVAQWLEQAKKTVAFEETKTEFWRAIEELKKIQNIRVATSDQDNDSDGDSPEWVSLGTDAWELWHNIRAYGPYGAVIEIPVSDEQGRKSKVLYSISRNLMRVAVLKEDRPENKNHAHNFLKGHPHVIVRSGREIFASGNYADDLPDSFYSPGTIIAIWKEPESGKRTIKDDGKVTTQENGDRAANAGETVVAETLPGDGDIRGPKVTDEQHTQWTAKIKALNEKISKLTEQERDLMKQIKTLLLEKHIPREELLLLAPNDPDYSQLIYEITTILTPLITASNDEAVENAHAELLKLLKNRKLAEKLLAFIKESPPQQTLGGVVLGHELRIAA